MSRAYNASPLVAEHRPSGLRHARKVRPAESGPDQHHMCSSHHNGRGHEAWGPQTWWRQHQRRAGQERQAYGPSWHCGPTLAEACPCHRAGCADCFTFWAVLEKHAPSRSCLELGGAGQVCAGMSLNNPKLTGVCAKCWAAVLLQDWSTPRAVSYRVLTLLYTTNCCKGGMLHEWTCVHDYRRSR